MLDTFKVNHNSEDCSIFLGGQVTLLSSHKLSAVFGVKSIQGSLIRILLIYVIESKPFLDERWKPNVVNVSRRSSHEYPHTLVLPIAFNG